MSIDSIVSLVVGKISELLDEEAKFLYGVEDQVRSLQEELRMMQSFLIDMEAMDEEEGDERSRVTIKQIGKIAYDAEDVIDSYILEASSSANKKQGFLKRYVCGSFVRTRHVRSKIQDIKARIAETIDRWKKYAGENGARGDEKQGLSKRTRARMRPIAYSHTHEDHVIGLDEDVNKLVGVLTHEEYYKIKVVSIVGMGGSGKTTLGRKLFNHEIVKKKFDCKAWVSVSQKWNAHQIILDLLKKVSGETRQTGEFSDGHQVLVEKLYQYLEMKNYLIVLDDVWEDKALEDILPALPLGSDGRKIIVTTRNEEVANYPDLKPLTYTHKPRRLNEEESWELFRKIALVYREETYNSTDIAKLEELGKEMLKKCRGLPLGVIALAGILSQKETFDDWEKAKKAVARRIMDDGKGTHSYGSVKEMLTLSYNDLPRELKLCFLYLARYPEDHEISVGELMKLWIAEGFFTFDEPHEEDTLEDVAHQCLDELVHRCLVEVAMRNSEGKVKRIRIHDLVRDLCIKKAKEGDFLEIFTSKAPNSDTIVTESRRTVIFSDKRIAFPFPTKSQHLRSLVYVDDDITRDTQLSLKVIHQNFRLLRVLILDGIRTSGNSLPAGIGGLIHLRHLGLRHADITELPSSIGDLRNLLTLDCRFNLYIIHGMRIPDVFWKIEGLRHLYLPDFAIVEGPPTVAKKTFKLHTLKHLQTLKGMRGGNWMLEELPRLSRTVQKLSIKGITSQEQLESAFQCPSISSDCLHSLYLEWENRQGLKVDNLEPIIHSQHLRKLLLRGRIEDRLSNIRFATSIMKLGLWHAELEAEATLVALGKLPQLTILKLPDGAYRGTRWTCSAGEFPQLKKLVMHELGNLEEWSIERGAMPHLRTLAIMHCKKLRKLPEGLKFITTLQELHLYRMPGEFYKRIEGGGEDAHLLQHVPLVKIRKTSLRGSTSAISVPI